jgi:hypothetical protein
MYSLRFTFLISTHTRSLRIQHRTIEQCPSTHSIPHRANQQWSCCSTLGMLCCSHTFLFFFFFFWRYGPNLALGYLHETSFHFGLLDLKTVGRTPWTGDQLVARPLTVHKHRNMHTHTQTPNIHALSVIRTHYPGFRAREDSTCLRPLGYRDRHTFLYLFEIWSPSK